MLMPQSLVAQMVNLQLTETAADLTPIVDLEIRLAAQAPAIGFYVVFVSSFVHSPRFALRCRSTNGTVR